MPSAPSDDERARYKAAARSYVEARDFVTFAALHRELAGDAREASEILMPGNRVVWAGMPQALFDAVVELLDEGVLAAVPGSRAAYVRDGRVLDLPAEKRPPPHPERRWFPVLLRPMHAVRAESERADAGSR